MEKKDFYNKKKFIQVCETQLFQSNAKEQKKQQLLPILK